MKALVGAFNQEKALVGAFSVIVQPVMEPMGQFAALISWLRERVAHFLCGREKARVPGLTFSSVSSVKTKCWPGPVRTSTWGHDWQEVTLLETWQLGFILTHLLQFSGLIIHTHIFSADPSFNYSS